MSIWLGQRAKRVALGMQTFKSRLDELDLSLFSAISSQSTEGDHRSWLAVQRAIRAPSYNYFEIGSYRGGSLQQHLVDPMCASIVSIDVRQFAVPDDRGNAITYEANSTEQMLGSLQKIAPTQKITTLECDASEIDPAALPAKPDFCFIDGEHTREAVISDFEYCYKICSTNAAICLHDARIIHPAITYILSFLRKNKVHFRAGRLPDDTFGIFLNECRAADDPFIKPHLGNSNKFLRRMRVRHLFKSLLPKATHSTFANLFPAP